jgi:hypothetical protein
MLALLIGKTNKSRGRGLKTARMFFFKKKNQKRLAVSGGTAAPCLGAPPVDPALPLATVRHPKMEPCS